nr:biotin-dependent carboxyltransferase family protein [uncultured Sphaerochaeta sp.]
MSALARIRITRAAPLTTVQDAGRFGALGYGIAASGPMDLAGWAEAGGASSGIEFTMAGLEFEVLDGRIEAGLGGGGFVLRVNAIKRPWPNEITLNAGDRVAISPGASGVYGYVRFSGEIGVPPVLGSRATNTIAGLGGRQGKPLVSGDVLDIVTPDVDLEPPRERSGNEDDAPLCFVWGVHADLFDARERAGFVAGQFHVSRRLDRMGVRLEDRSGVFSHAQHLSLVSDAVVPGDIQILGDGTPIVLMRDHQPTGGYPRIGTLLSYEIGRFAQMRPGKTLRFKPVSITHTSAAPP